MKKIASLKILAFALAIMVFSCGKDDGPETPTPQSPEITSFSPTSGPVGTTVEISGKNFSTTKTDNTVKFNGQAAVIQTATATKLTVTVPNGATTGNITVKVGDKTASSATAFTVTNGTNESIVLNKTSLQLSTLDTDQLSITNLNEFDDPVIVWNADNADVIQVDGQGNISALQAGTAKVTVTIGSLTATCDVTVEPSVFVVGQDNDEATVWINGSKLYSYPAEGGYSTVGKSIEVQGSDVFVGGYELGVEIYYARGWKNKDLIFSLETYSQVEEVAINNGDLYFVGHEENRATVWNDGNPSYLTEDVYNSFAMDAFSYNGKLYVIGQESSAELINCVLWNASSNTSQDIAPGQFGGGAFGRGIYVSEIEGQVHKFIAGFEDIENANYSVVKIWDEQGELYQLTDGAGDARALSIAGNGNSMAVGGFEESYDPGYQKHAMIWIIKDNMVTSIDLGNAEVYSGIEDVYLFDNHIYAVGQKDTFATMWKLDMNGQIIEEVPLSINDSEANGIVVK
ncbi:hypothetical protein F8C76_11785 [Flagellimonas olearia]|uniref:IPT/TIG domain-containing protein n=1 Tax=Flagellimonas olearia TaxID=552546 RepID=A0A6I1DYZ5_9FLAO|nr:IPT/TIG domain-containing protein [Allomuricauda olearia]KAB7528537.1 hypothetical protein F8C76_11785 [Allomuricauda olearia]